MGALAALAKKRVRLGIDCTVGAVRFAEWRLIPAKAATGPRAWWRERREIRRIRAQLGKAVPRAKVACVIPTYRRASVTRAVSSVLAQTLNDLVVIIVDDGGDFATSFTDPRVITVRLGRNLGPGVARNVGIAISDSEFVAFLDDDNQWKARHLEVGVEALCQGFDLVYTAMARFDNNGHRVDILSEPFDRSRLARTSYIDTSSLIARRTKALGFSRVRRLAGVHVGEDWEFVYRLTRRHRAQHVPEVTVDYLMNPDSYFHDW